MKNYTVISQVGVAIASGILALDEKQYKSRAHALVDLGEGLYEVRSPTQFKQGETFGYDGEINKSLLEEIQEIVAAVEEAVVETPEKTTAEKVQEVNDEIAKILAAEKEKFGNGSGKKAKK